MIYQDDLPQGIYPPPSSFLCLLYQFKFSIISSSMSEKHPPQFFRSLFNLADMVILPPFTAAFSSDLFSSRAFPESYLDDLDFGVWIMVFVVCSSGLQRFPPYLPCHLSPDLSDLASLFFYMEFDLLIFFRSSEVFLSQFSPDDELPPQRGVRVQ